MFADVIEAALHESENETPVECVHYIDKMQLKKKNQVIIAITNQNLI